MTRSRHESHGVSLQLLNGHASAEVEAMIREANSQDGTPAAFLWRPADDTLEAANESIDTLVRTCTSDAARPFNVDDPDRSVMRPHCLRMSHHSEDLLAPSSPPSAFLLVLCLPSAALQRNANAGIVSLLYENKDQPLGVQRVEYFDWRVGLWVKKFEGFLWNPQHTYDVVTGTYTSTPTAPAAFTRVVHGSGGPTVVDLAVARRDGPTAEEVSCGDGLALTCNTFVGRTNMNTKLRKCRSVALEPLATALTEHTSSLHRLPSEVVEVHVLPFMTTHDAIVSLRVCNRSTAVAFDMLAKWVDARVEHRVSKMPSSYPWRAAEIDDDNRGPLDECFSRVPAAVAVWLDLKTSVVSRTDLKKPPTWPRHTQSHLPQMSDCFEVTSEMVELCDQYDSIVEAFTTELLGPLRKNAKGKGGNEVTLPGHPQMFTAPLAHLGGADGLFCGWETYADSRAKVHTSVTYYLGPLETKP